MKKTYSGKYSIRNRDIYRGDPTKVTYRSNWEKQAFIWLEKNNNVEWWNSEEMIVPYFYEVDKKRHRYHVDLLIKWKDGRTVMVEIKPKKQTVAPKVKNPKSKRSLNEAFAYIKNMNKWEAATEVAKDNGWHFEIWTEIELRKKGILKKEPGKLKKMKPMKPYRKIM
jgi:hypothetical protein